MSFYFSIDAARSELGRCRSGNVKCCERVTLFFTNMDLDITYVVNKKEVVRKWKKLSQKLSRK